MYQETGVGLLGGASSKALFTLPSGHAGAHVSTWDLDVDTLHILKILEDDCIVYLSAPKERRGYA